MRKTKIETPGNEFLAVGALHQAIIEHQPSKGLVHHTDRGGQYAVKPYRSLLLRAGMHQTISRADNCYNNSFIESTWGAFKRELAIADLESVARARTTLAEFVRYYRFERKHSSLDYLMPYQFATRPLAFLISTLPISLMNQLRSPLSSFFRPGPVNAYFRSPGKARFLFPKAQDGHIP